MLIKLFGFFTGKGNSSFANGCKRENLQKTAMKFEQKKRKMTKV